MKLRKVLILSTVTAVLLCGCGREKNEYFELENTPWGMTMEETLKAYGIENTGDVMVVEGKYSQDFVLEDGREIFGVKTERITFDFLDVTVSGNTPRLSQIVIDYPADTDMNEVIKEMKKSFGDTTDKVIYYPIGESLINDTVSPLEFEADEKLTLWESKTVAEAVPKAQAADYEKLWETPMGWLTPEQWPEFSQNASLVSAYGYNGSKDAPMESEKGFRINAVNLLIYRNILEQLEESN